jgi:hypothetical protein
MDDLKGRDHFEDIGSEYEPVASSCEHGYEPSGSVKDGEFLDYLGDC